MSRDVINLLARVLYEVINHKVSIDVAFKRACRGRCASGLEERERLYELSREFISDYFKVMCVAGTSNASYRALARLWLKGIDESKLSDPTCKFSYNRWFYDRLKELLGGEVNELLSSMNKRRWWLRINTLLSSIEHVLRLLDSEGVEYIVDKEYPYLVKVVKSPKPIRLLRAVKEFKAIPQDKSSVAVVHALKPSESDVIVDMAAAPGMKTSLIMMLTENKARVVAIDVSVKRIKVMRGLLRRLGVDLSRVYPVLADSIYAKVSYADKALLDAPCSNSGAIDKDPSIKVNLSPGKIEYYSDLQFRLLSNAVKLASEVVYATCSLMPEEGELVLDRLIRESPMDFKLVREIPWTSTGYRIVKFYDRVMRTFPHIHDSEGFFIAKIVLK